MAICIPLAACIPPPDRDDDDDDPAPPATAPPPPPATPPPPTPPVEFVSGWQGAESFGSATESYVPRLAVDASGNAFAVWRRGNGTLGLNRFNVETGWEGMQEFLVGGAPAIAMDADGNAIVVYSTGDNIAAIRYDVEDGWGEPQLLENLANWCHSGRIAMDGNGNAIAVFAERSGTAGASNYRVHLWAVRYDALAGWGAPQLIEPFDSVSQDPNIAMTAAGQAMVVWTESVYGGTYGIWAARYNGSAWESPTYIDPWGGFNAWDGGDVIRPGAKIGLDAQGNAIAAWIQDDEAWNAQWTRTSIWTNRYTVGSGWGTPTALENDWAISRGVSLAVSSNGTAYAAWSQWDGNVDNPTYVRACRYNGTWSSPQDFGPGSVPRLSSDAFGRAIMVWDADDGLTASVYESGWGQAEVIDGLTNGAHHDVALSDAGLGFAAWQAGGTIWANVWSED